MAENEVEQALTDPAEQDVNDRVEHYLSNPVPHQFGNPEAPMCVVEFGDYECPYCAGAAPVLRELVSSSDGHLRLIYRNFPLFEVHPHALTAALAAESTAATGGEQVFWEMHWKLFTHQARLSKGGVDVGQSLPEDVGVVLDDRRFGTDPPPHDPLLEQPVD